MTHRSTDAPDWGTIPAPPDDGAARHLLGLRVPPVGLPATNGNTVDLSQCQGRVVLYAYPRTGEPGKDNPQGWDLIAGARGCTPQACAMRDHFADLAAAGVQHLFGISTQSREYQREVVERLHLPYPLLSDEDLLLAHAMRLPTFSTSGMTLLRRLTLVIDQAVVSHLFYPIFPPDAHAGELVGWLNANPVR